MEERAMKTAANEREMPRELAAPKLPLHPRKAQQVFFELLQWKEELTPQSAMTPLPKRIQLVQFRTNVAFSQEQYLQGVYETKRGREFTFYPRESAEEPQRVMLRLTRDGSRLQVLQLDRADHGEQGLDIESVALVDIQQISVCALPEFSFAIRIRASDSNQPEEELTERPTTGGSTLLHEDSAIVFAAPNAAVLSQWVCTLTCGANTFQRQVQQQSEKAQEETQRQPMTMTSLIWQAARLRIFELAKGLTLQEAIALVAHGVQQFLSNEELRGLEDPQHPLMFLSTCTSSLSSERS